MRALIAALLAATLGCSALLVTRAAPVTRGNYPVCTEGVGPPVVDGLAAVLAGLIAAGAHNSDDAEAIVIPAAIAAVYLASAGYGFYSVNECRNAQLEAAAAISPHPFRAPSIPPPRDAGAVDRHPEDGPSGG